MENGSIDTRWIVLIALAVLFIIAIPFIKNKISYNTESVATSKISQISPTPNVLSETDSVSEAEYGVSDIIENPDTYTDQNIDMEGIVDTVYGSGLLTVDGPGFMPVQNLLVLNTYAPPGEGEDQLFITGNRIRVLGTVRKMTDEMRKSFGLTTILTDNLFAQYKGKPVVVANSVEKVGEE